MKNRILVILMFIGFINDVQAKTQMDTVTIEVTDQTLSSLYYHQDSFDMPTKLVFPNLTRVQGYAYFHQNVNLISVDMPILNYVGDYMYFNGNTSINTINAPALDTIHNYLYVSGNSSLTEFNICSLTHILSSEEEFFEIPYYLISNNTFGVDQLPQCFSQGPPENLSLSNLSVPENSPQYSIIGTLSAEGNYPENSFTYYLTNDNFNNDSFIIEDDTLKANATFDFEIENEYDITIGVYNQLGETITKNYTIVVEDIINEDIQVIEILDDTLSSLYYHQENYTKQTQLVFPNLTTVLEYAYFHQNVNLISVDMPNLNYVGDYIYFHGNEVLEIINAPTLDTIHNYLYVNGNTSLTELNICSLTHILSSEEVSFDIPYYLIANNTNAVDQTPFCFSQGGPENLNLSNATIEENSPQYSIIGTLSAEGNYPENSFTYFLTNDNFNNDSFIIEDDTLKSNATFDFEIENEYDITIGVYNQLGELTTKDYTISIEDVLIEGIQIVEILDDTLSSLYYHQENFTTQTKLVFPNLTRVDGYAYFHQNVNLISVDLPKLSYVGDYMYFHGNEVIDSIKAPVLDTLHNYLYVSSNTNLTELDICSLTHIISTEPESESYYYIQNNPVLDFSTTCLDSTILEFSPLDSLIETNYIQVGSFESNSTDQLMIFINEGGTDVTETDDFIIIDENLYLQKGIEEYTEDNYPLLITTFRIDQNSGTNLNEQILLDINVDVKDKSIITDLKEIELTKQWIAYPNPTNSFMTIISNQKGFFTLSNQYGTMMESYKFSVGHNTINLSHFSAGLYFLRSDSGKTVKIIKSE